MNEILNIVKYGSKTFSEIRDDLFSYIRQTYPDVINDFTDAGVGSMLIDINAGVANNLHSTIDRVFQENTVEYAQQRKSIHEIAKTHGFKIPPKRPSVTVVDITVQVPVLGDRPNEDYYPVLSPGAQIIGGGRIFETQDVIDWSLPFSSLGDVNRSIIPNYNSNGVIISYNVTKREVVVNGSSNIYRKIINTDDAQPFFKVTLPDPNVIEVQNVILVEGSSNLTTPSIETFFNSENRYYEVDYLAQQRVFIDDPNAADYKNPQGVRMGKWVDVTKKFMTEYNENGYCSLIFGSGNDSMKLKEMLKDSNVNNKEFLSNVLNNTALGERIKPNHTLFVRYRVGGGSNTNLGTGVLNGFASYDLQLTGPRNDVNRVVEKSLTVTNPIPAIGGNDGLSVEQIRYLIKYNNSAQNRDVTLNDYLVQVYKMPGKFGSPYKANVHREHNKVVVSVLGLDEDQNLDNTSNSLLKENITEYLSQYRMVNDYIEVRDGRIINLAFELELYVNNIAENQIISGVIELITEFFNTDNNEIGEDIYLGSLEKKIFDSNGVLNIVSLKVFNKVSGLYSSNMITQTIANQDTMEIEKTNNILYSTNDSMFEIKFPEKDIKIKLRKRI
ncbi:MAG: hypothetical protein ACOCVF_00325 [bacterium]